MKDIFAFHRLTDLKHDPRKVSDDFRTTRPLSPSLPLEKLQKAKQCIPQNTDLSNFAMTLFKKDLHPEIESKYGLR